MLYLGSFARNGDVACRRPIYFSSFARMRGARGMSAINCNFILLDALSKQGLISVLFCPIHEVRRKLAVWNLEKPGNSRIHQG